MHLESIPRSKFRLYWATQPPPDALTPDRLSRLIPTEFTTEEDAIHAAALLLRAKNHVWWIECPDGTSLGPAEIAEKCAPLIRLFAAAAGRK